MKTNNTFEPHAYLTVCNWGGIAIQINETGEAVRYKYLDNKPSRWCRIYYTAAGRAFFRARKRRYYLDEFMRI